MLGRTASSLYWMSRYQERAQNIARLLEVAYRTAMVPHQAQDAEEDWRFALTTSGSEQGYFEKFDEVSQRSVTNYLLFDKENASSVRGCLETARNNARSVRTGITSEIWEALNTTWIEFNDINPQSITQDRLPEFLSWVGQRSLLFRGALLGTILRDDGYCFSQLGNFVERADNTARVLNTQYWALLPDNDLIGGGTDRYQWTAILRALSGLRSYRFAYPDAKLKAFNIAEFLILRTEMPRSLAHCYNWIDSTFEDLADYYGERRPCMDVADRIWAGLKDGQMRDIYTDGLHDFLNDFVNKNNTLSAELSANYNFS